MELRRRGLLNEDGSVKPIHPTDMDAWEPDEGFGKSPNKRIYSGAT